MRRRQTKVPNMAQGSLGFAGENKTREESSGPKKKRVGGTLFLDATPWHLFVGQERLDEYLNKRGAGWVVKLRKELQEVDFGMLEVNYLGSGRPAYHPRMMMGLVVYGVLQGKHSLRELEVLAVTDVGAWLLCGGNQPDHSTIGDFLERHRGQITQEYFKELVRGLVTRKKIQAGVVAGDGTVVEASASRFELLSREAAEQVAEKAKAAAEQKPEDEELKERARAATEVAEVARERAKQKKDKGAKEADKASVVTPVEPEAVPQKCKDGRFRPGYKPSILVHEIGLIIGKEVEPSSESAAVAGLLDQHYEVFGANPEAALLDAGYHNEIVLSEALERGINILCPSGKTLGEQWQRRGNQGKFGKTQFVYDRDGDCYRCPAGHTMEPGAEYVHSGTRQRARKYKTKQCVGCPLRSQCTESEAGRVIVRLEVDELKEAMEEVMGQGRARRQYRKRREIVERVFAELGWRQGLRRFRRRGRSGVGLEFALHCIAYNLKWAIGRGPEALVTVILAYLRRLRRVSSTQAAEARITKRVGVDADLGLRQAA